ncbi:permease for cytosine/purines, uracil, thiamine, allantoin-domain-containing protein [Xylariaceae sp. FL0804]|nr:permease for cytosine/purines, uracil, thiamine, allantoin-domain-containing protein [Xylariaceae sp. FL0804]
MQLPRPRLPRTFRSLVVSRDDASSRWANPDVLPVPPHEIKYDWKAYFGYWFAVGFNTTVWSLASSNLANGLSAGAAIGGIFVGGVLAGLVAFFCGEPGVRYHLGFPMMSRSTFGMYGSYFVIAVKQCFVNFIFFGIQSYWGGLAASVVLGAIFPSFHHMPNTIPLDQAITTQQLIGFVIYIVVFTSLMFVHPSRLQPFIYFSQWVVNFTILGVFIWALSANGGVTLLPASKTISASTRSFQILQAISSVAGSWTGASIRQSDWTRFARTRNAAVFHQLLTGPVTLVVCATMGVAATSAVAQMYGSAIWNPIEVLETVQAADYNARARAGTFFAGLGFFVSQVTINLVQNSVSCGMDLASLVPKYIDVTRGSLFMCLVGYLIQPWKFVNQPGMFISVLNAFGMFVSPLAGINSVDFWLIRKLNWKVPDFYKNGGDDNIYWYTYGLNWRAFAAWILVVWASFPGFIASMTGRDFGTGWTRTFEVTWIVGFMGGGLVYWLLCTASPPPGGRPYVKELLDFVPEPEHRAAAAVEVEGQSVSEGDGEGKSAAAMSDVADAENGGKIVAGKVVA